MERRKDNRRLIFVYNAENGFFNAVTDTVHKIFSPSTYQCSLCFYTYGLSGKVKAWKDFLDTVPLRLVFLYRTEFFERYQARETTLPVIVLDDDEELTTVLSAEEIAGAGGLEPLIDRLKSRLRETADVELK